MKFERKRVQIIMAAKKIKDKDHQPKPEIYFVPDNDLYIYEMLEREQNCEAINEKNNTKKKIKNQKKLINEN